MYVILFVHFSITPLHSPQQSLGISFRSLAFFSSYPSLFRSSPHVSVSHFISVFFIIIIIIICSVCTRGHMVPQRGQNEYHLMSLNCHRLPRCHWVPFSAPVLLQ